MPRPFKERTTFGKLLANIRETRLISMDEMSARLKMGKAALSMLETGYRTPTEKFARKVMDEFSIGDMTLLAAQILDAVHEARITARVPKDVRAVESVLSKFDKKKYSIPLSTLKQIEKLLEEVVNGS